MEARIGKTAEGHEAVIAEALGAKAILWQESGT